MLRLFTGVSTCYVLHTLSNRESSMSFITRRILFCNAIFSLDASSRSSPFDHDPRWHVAVVAFSGAEQLCEYVISGSHLMTIWPRVKNSPTWKPPFIGLTLCIERLLFSE